MHFLIKPKNNQILNVIGYIHRINYNLMKVLDQIMLFKTNNLFELFEKGWGYVKLNFFWKLRL